MPTPVSFRAVDYADAAAAATLPAATRLGPVRLTVTNVVNSVPFYEQVVGLTEQWRGQTEERQPIVALGTEGDEPVLVLTQAPDAQTVARHSGLYHVALRYHEREELAHVVRRIAEQQVPIQGASDHGTHEAVYLSDPDGIGLELATDRPREQWPPIAEEFSRGGPQPLDIPNLVSASSGQPTHDRSHGVDVGHVHLHVGAIEPAERFYREVLGMALVAAMPTAVFMSAGGYHHHVAMNVWNGQGAPPQPDGAVGLRSWTVVVPTDVDLAAAQVRAEQHPAAACTVDGDGALVLRDPSGNTVVVETLAQRTAAPIQSERPRPPAPSA